MLEVVLRIAFSLLVVLALMWGVARMVRRPLARRGGAVLTVLARQQLGRGSSVAVLRVADRALLLGVTDQQVTLLAETDLSTVEQQQEPARRDAVRVDGPGAGGPGGAGGLAGSVLSPRTWSQALNALRDRTARKR